MAKENNKARVRVFFGEIDGDNETIRDGLRSIVAAVRETFRTGQPIVRVLSVEKEMSEEQLVEHVEKQLAEEPQLNSTQEIIAPSASKITTSPGKKKGKAPSLSFVKELNLRPDNKQSLREFYNLKSPKSQQECITVALYYLHRILETPQITCNHLFTALKEVEVRIPNNLPQTLRNISNRKGWIDSSNTDNLKTTVPGRAYALKSSGFLVKPVRGTLDPSQLAIVLFRLSRIWKTAPFGLV